MSMPDQAQHAIVVQLRRDMEPLLNNILDATTGLLENTSQKPWAEFADELQSIQTAVHRFRSTIDEAFAAAGFESGTINRSAFGSDVYHDIRSPLNPIIGYSALVLFESADINDEEFKAMLKGIGETGKHLLQLVEKLEKTIESHPDEES